jgi:hypothetical protein
MKLVSPRAQAELHKLDWLKQRSRSRGPSHPEAWLRELKVPLNPVIEPSRVSRVPLSLLFRFAEIGK